MYYDKNVHLPQVVEMFIQDFHNGDVEKLENNKTLLLKLIEDQAFKKNLAKCDSIRDQKILELFQKAQEALKTLLETKNPKELFIDVVEIQNDLSSALLLVERDYWETVYKEITQII